MPSLLAGWLASWLATWLDLGWRCGSWWTRQRGGTAWNKGPCWMSDDKPEIHTTLPIQYRTYVHDTPLLAVILSIILTLPSTDRARGKRSGERDQEQGNSSRRSITSKRRRRDTFGETRWASAALEWASWNGCFVIRFLLYPSLAFLYKVLSRHANCLD